METKILKKEVIPSYIGAWNKMKKWTRIGVAVGCSFIAADVVYENHQENKRYDHYIEQNFDSHQKVELNRLFKDLELKMGASTVTSIKDADKRAFLKREKNKDKNVKTKLSGFDKAGMDPATTERFLSENTFFPKHWINGKIDEIKYEDKVLSSGNKIADGMFDKTKNNVVFFKRKEIELTSMEKKVIPWYFKSVLSHESGHANSWNTDQDLSLLDRAELLDKVLKRIGSPDAYKSTSASQSGHEYWRESSDPFQEYWAEICSEYFSNPSYLKEKFHKDFDLVNNRVLKYDPDFNVFKAGGPYFDKNTGVLLPKWKLFMEELPPIHK